MRALEDEISLSDLSRGLRSGQGSRDYDYENGNNYNIEMGRLKKLALESQAFGSDYSGSTSAEYKGNQKPDMMSSTEYQQTMASQEMRPTSAATATMFSPPIRQVRNFRIFYRQEFWFWHTYSKCVTNFWILCWKFC